jgi:hypothetical protein
MYLAMLGRHVGVDLWNAQTSDGRGIRKALDFLLPFALDKKPWPYQEISGFQAQALHPLIRRASQAWPDKHYQELAAKLPPIAESDLDQLVGTRLLPDKDARK